MRPTEFFDESQLGITVYREVYDELSELGDFEAYTTKSQVAFRRRRGFAYLWLPGKYLSNPDAEVVLSIALDRRIESSRFKEVAHPSDSIWQHHIEISDIDDIDDEVRTWLRDAYDSAG